VLTWTTVIPYKFLFLIFLADRQYNTIHTLLGQLPDVTIHKCIYAPYSDTGLFGSYFHGNEVHAFQMLYMSQLVASDYALYVSLRYMVIKSLVEPRWSRQSQEQIIQRIITTRNW